MIKLNDDLILNYEIIDKIFYVFGYEVEYLSEGQPEHIKSEFFRKTIKKPKDLDSKSLQNEIALALIDRELIDKKSYAEKLVRLKWLDFKNQFRKFWLETKNELFNKELEEKAKINKEDKDIEIDEESLNILRNPKLLDVLFNEAQKFISGEEDTIKAIHICINGRNVENHQTASYNLLVNSDSGAGKDYVVTHILDILPKNEYVKKTKISPNVFTYWHNSKFEPLWTWNKKIFFCEDIAANVLNADVFKVMCSSGSNATVVINQMAIDIEIKGKPVIITTTAQGTPSKELTRRFAIINLNETIEQTEAIMKKIAEAEMKGIIIDKDEKLTKALSYLKRVKVIVPYADKLISFFPKQHLIMRTHFARFLDFIKASASLYQYQRDKTEEGYILANGQDYDIARDVLIKMTSNQFMIPLTREQRKILEVLKDLVIEKYECNNCHKICESDTCPKCYERDMNGRIAFPATKIELRDFTVQEIESNLRFFTSEERWLRIILNTLTSYGFLVKSIRKKASVDKPSVTYSYVDLSLIDIPKWVSLKDIIKVNEVNEVSNVSI